MNKTELFQGMYYVYEVYKEMSFSKAARNLYISQPSLSNAVKRTEGIIGAPIFDRSKNPIGLTNIGREYIRSAEIIMDVENGFESYMNNLTELRSGSLSVGGTTLYSSYVLPPIIKKYTSSYPMVNVDIVESTTDNLKQMLLDGNLDLLIHNSEMDRDFYDRKFFCTENILLVVPAVFEINKELKDFSFTSCDIKEKKHLDPDRSPVALTYFRNEPFVLLTEGNDTRLRADRMFEAEGIRPRVKLEPTQQFGAYNYACNEIGIAFVGDTLIQHIPEDDRVLFYKLNRQFSVRDVNIYYKKNRFMSKAAEVFLSLY